MAGYGTLKPFPQFTTAELQTGVTMAALSIRLLTSSGVTSPLLIINAGSKTVVQLVQAGITIAAGRLAMGVLVHPVVTAEVVY